MRNQNDEGGVGIVLLCRHYCSHSIGLFLPRVPTLLIPDPMFKNVVAIVSGGASGLGAATASYLVRHGARVVVADLPRAYDTFLKLEEETAAGIEIIGGDGSGASIKFASADVTKEDDVKMALNVAEEVFGEQGMPN